MLGEASLGYHWLSSGRSSKAPSISDFGARSLMNFRRLSPSSHVSPFHSHSPTLGRSLSKDHRAGPGAWPSQGQDTDISAVSMCLSTAHISSPQLLQLGPRTGLPPRSGRAGSSESLGNSEALLSASVAGVLSLPSLVGFLSFLLSFLTPSGDL